jgi:DNA-binding beta-propeller fold protein YncE
MKHNTIWLAILLVFSTAVRPAYAQYMPVAAGRPAGTLAGPPTESNFAYPQSIFVDSRNGEIWVTDFDNNRVLRFDISSPTGAAQPTGTAGPETYALGQNYPNPFNPGTMITFALENTEEATLTVHTVLGQEVATLFRGIAAARVRYALSFDAAHLPSGVYFYALRTAHRYEVKKMGVMK